MVNADGSVPLASSVVDEAKLPRTAKTGGGKCGRKDATSKKATPLTRETPSLATTHED